MLGERPANGPRPAVAARDCLAPAAERARVDHDAAAGKYADLAAELPAYGALLGELVAARRVTSVRHRYSRCHLVATLLGFGPSSGAVADRDERDRPAIRPCRMRGGCLEPARVSSASPGSVQYTRASTPATSPPSSPSSASPASSTSVNRALTRRGRLSAPRRTGACSPQAHESPTRLTCRPFESPPSVPALPPCPSGRLARVAGPDPSPALDGTCAAHNTTGAYAAAVQWDRSRSRAMLERGRKDSPARTSRIASSRFRSTPFAALRRTASRRARRSRSRSRVRSLRLVDMGAILGA